MGIARGTYSRWAKLYGFRQGDLHPEARQAGARVSTPAGPGGYCRSGQHYLDLPVPEDDARRVSGAEHPSWRGGAAASRAGYQALRDERRDAFMSKVAFMADEDVLKEVRALADAGRLTEVDRWLSAWAAAQRREKLIGALEKAVQGFAEVDRPIGASGQPMKTLKEIQAMSDEELYAHVERLVAPGTIEATGRDGGSGET